MSKLVRLFPWAWRERYGEEFEALLEETPMTVRAVGDVIRAAANARLRWLLAPVDARLDVLAAGRLGGASAQRAGAACAVGGGLLWALTFVVGSAVDWGRWGNDLGFLLLIAAAGLLLVAHVTAAVTTTSPALVIDWLGVVISSVGAVLLSVALIAAIVLERPLTVRLLLSPQQYWEAGMLATIIGASVSALAGATDGRRRWVTASLITGSTIALGLALVLTFDGPVLVSARQSFVGQHGWFVGNLTVSVAGILHGVGWLALGLDRLGLGRWHGRRRHAKPTTGGD